MTNFNFIVFFLLTFLFIYVTITIALTIYLWVEIKSLKNSTHNIEYVPLDPKWATSEERARELQENQAFDEPLTDPDDLDETELDLNKML